MHLIAVDDQVRYRSLGVGTINSDAKPVTALSRSITPLKILFNVMDIVLQQFYMGAGPDNVYAQWDKPIVGSAVVTNFKAFDPDVTLVVNRKYAASLRGSDMHCLQHRRFARIASKSNESIGRVAGCVDTHQLFVDSASNVDGTARPRGGLGVLNGAPRCRLRAGIRIIPGRRHVEGGVWLAKRSGDARKQYRES